MIHMVRFGMGEYVKNILYNIISVILLAATFVAMVIFSSNISAQAKMNKFYKPYIDNDSVITGYMGSQFDIDKLGLVKLERALYSQEIQCYSTAVWDLKECIVYEEYVMKNLTPKLKEGKIVMNGSGDMLNVLITENRNGVAVGDVIELNFFTVEGMEEGRTITIQAKVMGVIKSGQKLFYGNGVKISRNMSLNDVIGTHNFEQLGYSMIIIPEGEMMKISEEILWDAGRCLLKFQEDITEEERNYNYRKLIDYETQYGISGMIETFPQMSSFVELHKEETENIILTNAPLCVAIVILVAICIVCMVSIRNARSMKYYATLYICGMPLKNAMIFAGIEMAINSILAILLGTAIIEIQMKREIFGEINCVLNIEQWLIIIGISVFMIASVMITTFKTLKERSPMSVLRDTAY